ncbi:MAG: sulfite exporter TauE/SafE family protein [Hyphomicrobiaceae bacterium]
MPAELPFAEILLMAGALAVAGLVVGYLAGLLGIGGGGISVPILYEVFGLAGVDDAVRMHLAVGTSLAVILPTSLRSFTLHRRRGAVDMEVLRTVGPGVLLGTMAGILIAKEVDGTVLKIVFVAVAFLMALKLLSGADRWQLGAVLPGSIARLGLGVVTGVASALNGIGGGAFITSFMTLYGRPMLPALATASGIGPIIALPGVIGYAWAGFGNPALPFGSLGYVSLIGATFVIPSSLMAASWGVRSAHYFSRRVLELAFATFMILVGTRFLLSLVG